MPIPSAFGARNHLPRAIRLFAAIVAGYAVAALVTNTSVAVTIRAEVALVFIFTAFRPAAGLVLVAAMAPLGDMIVPLLGPRTTMHADAVVLAFVSAWLARSVAGADRSMGANRLASAMWVFSCVVTASLATTALELYRVDPARLHGIAIGLAQSYLLMGTDPIGAHSAGTLLEGIALVAAVVEIAQREPRMHFWLPRILVASVAVTSVASGLLVIGVAPAATIARHAAVGLPRYAAAMSDVNAAASCYLLLLGVSVGLAAASGSRARWAWWLASAVIIGGVGLTGSRAALVGLGVVLCAAAVMSTVARRPHQTKFVAAIIAAIGIFGAIAAAFAPTTRSSLGMRAGFTHASLQMIEASPAFGVGTGRYYTLSRLVLPPSLGWSYGQEHAHNYFLQTAAEIGIVGAVASVWLLGAILIGPIRRAQRRPIQWVSAGAAAGAIAYLVTALTGQPFLVPEAVIPLWIVLGLLAAEDAMTDRERAFPSRSAIAFGCVLLLTVPFRPGVPQLRLSTPEDGFTEWKTDEHGRPFRAIKDFASLFMAPTVTIVEIPLRLADENPAASATVSVEVPDWARHQVPVSHEWSTVLISLPADDPLMPSERINLAVSPLDGRPVAYVGQIRIVEARH